jgi:hypothetical protein
MQVIKDQIPRVPKLAYEVHDLKEKVANEK